ncbi:hypothetical protein JZ751_010538 [Albula glossodonta]|uniref:Uncharacterized protein n=1 Tax=Albula glossodonta TaxID=121402 RepID=A0A8T2NXF6_9TELE|nr:hypothetical protein JZ751_010538 [Albula glossodonta]
MDDDIVMHDADCSFVMSEDWAEYQGHQSLVGKEQRTNTKRCEKIRRPWESRFFCPPFPQVSGSLQHLSASHPLFSSLFPDARSMRLQMSPRFPRSFGVQRYSRLMQPEDSEKPKEEDLDQRIRALQAKNKEILRRFKDSPRGVWMVGDDFPLDECADLREYLCWKKEAERTGWESGQSHDAVQWRRP